MTDTKWLSEDEREILGRSDDPFRSELDLFAERLAAERERNAKLVEWGDETIYWRDKELAAERERNRELVEVVDHTRESLKHERERNTELEAIFALQHERTAIADALWREETGRYDTLPDLGTLIDWLMNWGETAEKRNAELVEALQEIRETITMGSREMRLYAKAALAKNGGQS